jgi:DnaJ-class molecular chaperone
VSTIQKPGDELPPGLDELGEGVCPKCEGAGHLGDLPCPDCGGSGKMQPQLGDV